MFEIGLALYAALTIVAVPILLVLIYVVVVNNKYRDTIEVFNLSTSNALGWGGLVAVVYFFITGFCVGDVVSVWRNIFFIACLAFCVFIAFVICKILKFYNKDRIKYANVLRADEQIREKIETANKQLGELKTTTNMSTSPEAKKMYKERIKEMEEMIRKLGEIHDELQAQKIIMNASLSTKELKNVSLKDNKSVNKAIDRERDKISAFHNINDSLGDVDDIMKKYKI
jgi:hypothetical protein